MKQINPKILKEVIDYCGSVGLLLKQSKDLKDYYKSIPAPISLFPSNIPEPYFSYAISMQPIFNTLIEKLARDYKTIHETLKPFAETDEFPRRLLEVSSKYHASKHQQTAYLGIIRSDYMIDCHKQRLSMIEYNTIASSFGVLSDKLNDLQRYLFKKYPELFPKNFTLDKMAPSNQFIESATAAFAKCIQIYKKKVNPEKDRQLCIAVIIQADELNVYDQKPLEIESFNKYGIRSMRLTLKEVYDNGKDRKSVV